MGRKRKSANIAVKFAARDIDLIVQSLPNGVSKKGLKLLPKVLREWSRTELPRHLSLESLKIIRERGKKVELFEKHASALLHALDALDDLGRRRIVHRVATRETAVVGQNELTLVKEELVALHNFLTSVAPANPHPGQKFKFGRQRNYIAYLVILDIVAIFEWITKAEATRQVDRDGKGDTGPFWEFAEVIWSLVFGNGNFGLSSAVKNWASGKRAWKLGRSEVIDRSPLIINIALRHPSWGILQN